MGKREEEGQGGAGTPRSWLISSYPTLFVPRGPKVKFRQSCGPEDPVSRHSAMRSDGVLNHDPSSLPNVVKHSSANYRPYTR
jgi:hypothetical protein